MPCLQVLRRFLSVLGAFDWEHYCLALQGPLPLLELHNPRGECLVECIGGGRLLPTSCSLLCFLPACLPDCLFVCLSVTPLAAPPRPCNVVAEV